MIIKKSEEQSVHSFNDDYNYGHIFFFLQSLPSKQKSRCANLFTLLLECSLFEGGIGSYWLYPKQGFQEVFIKFHDRKI